MPEPVNENQVEELLQMIEELSKQCDDFEKEIKLLRIKLRDKN